MTDFVKSVTNFSKSYDKVISKNNNIRIGLLGILILYSVLIVPLMSINNIKFLENNVVRIILIIIISLVCLIDPVVSIILAICFVVSLHRLNVLHTKEVSNKLEDQCKCGNTNNNCVCAANEAAANEAAANEAAANEAAMERVAMERAAEIAR